MNLINYQRKKEKTYLLFIRSWNKRKNKLNERINTEFIIPMRKYNQENFVKYNQILYYNINKEYFEKDKKNEKIKNNMQSSEKEINENLLALFYIIEEIMK